MNIIKSQNEGKSVFTLSGRLDVNSAPKLQDVLLSELDMVKEIVLDFIEIVYVSSAGLRVLLACEKAAKSKGKIMTLTNVSPDIMEIFKMTGFIKVLRII